MKYAIRGIGAVVALAIIYLTTAFFVPAARLGPVCAPIYALAIHLGLVDVKSADWGYLKLRSADYGTKALRWIERNSDPKTAQVSVAVQNQWFEAGHVFEGGHLIGDTTQEKETTFKDLVMPQDARKLPQAPDTGQSIPASFWRDQRFRACDLEPANCTLRMADITGDGKPEVIVEWRYAGTYTRFYANPVYEVAWDVFGRTDDEWTLVAKYYPCEVEQSLTDGKMRPSDQKLDMLWIDGHAVNFFSGKCFSSQSTEVPTKEHDLAARNIKAIETYPLLPSSKPLPLSLKAAILSRSIVLPRAGGAPIRMELEERGKAYRPDFKVLPPCFTAARQCKLLITDLDHDGREDVIVLDADIRSVRERYRVASLLMEKKGAWHLIDNHSVCVEALFEDMKVALKPAKWRALEFAGKLVLPEEETDTCSEAHLYPLL